MHSLSFTSGTTPANLFEASMAAEPSLPHTCEALVGLKTRSYHAVAHSVRSGRPEALPTELSWLGFKQLNCTSAISNSQRYFIGLKQAINQNVGNFLQAR